MSTKGPCKVLYTDFNETSYVGREPKNIWLVLKKICHSDSNLKNSRINIYVATALQYFDLAMPPAQYLFFIKILFL